MKRFILLSVLLLGCNILMFSQRPTLVQVLVEWSKSELIYNGQPQAPTATASIEISKGQTVSLPLIVKGEETNAGKRYMAKAYIDLPNAGDYTLLNNETEFAIRPAEAAVVWNTASLPYNGQTQVPPARAFGVNGRMDLLPITVRGGGTNAGPYQAVALIDEKIYPLIANNYILTNETTKFSISKASVPVQWGNTTLTYTGSPQAPTATATGVLGENLIINISGAQTNPGTYTATASIPPIFMGAPDNYTLTNTTTTFEIVGITQQTVEVVWSNTELTYNGSPQAPTAKATVGSGGSSFDLPLKITGAQTNAGGYTATAAIDGNYPAYELTNETVYFSISLVPITVQWGNVLLPYTGSPQAPTVKPVTDIFGANLPITVIGEQTDVGTYMARVAFSPYQNNYYITNEYIEFYIVTAGQGTYVIIDWDDTPLIYNGKPQTPKATAKTANGLDVPLKITGSGIDAGGYEATAEIDAKTTDLILANPTCEFWIDRAPATVKWSHSEMPYTGKPQLPTVSVTGVLGEKLPVEVYYDEEEAIALGTYTVYLYLHFEHQYSLELKSDEVSLRSEEVNDNYYLSYYGNISDFYTYEYEIVPAQIPVQWSNTTLIYNGKPQVPTATATGVMGEKLALKIQGSQTDVGTGYNAKATLAMAAPIGGISKSPFLPTNNYVLTNETTTFDIVEDSPTAIYITVTWDNTPLIYNGQPQMPAFTVTNNLGYSDLPVSAWGEQTDAGTGYYASVYLGSFGFNGEVHLMNSTTYFDINPATIPVQWGNTSLFYNGAPQAPTAAAKGVMNENLPLNVTGAQTNPGFYSASATLQGSYDPYGYYITNNNYVLINDYTPFTIYDVSSPSSYVVQWGNTSLTYNGNEQAPTAVAINNQGESLPVDVTGAKTDVGKGYTATASLGYSGSSYELLNATTSFDIAVEYVTVQWGNTMLFYDGKPQAPAASARGVKGENLPLNVTGAQTEAGEDYEAMAALRNTNNNYMLINVATLFDIVQLTSNDYIVEWGNTQFTYNGEPQAPTATATNTLGQSIALTVTGARTNARTGYTATATLSVPDINIELHNATTLFDIAPAPLAIRAVSETILLGQTPVLAYTHTSGQLFGSDALTGALAVETLTASPVQPPYPIGEYTIVQGTLTAGNNYAIDFTKGTLIVAGSLEERFEIIVNDKPTKQEGDAYKAEPAENGETEAVVYVLANPGETISIGGVQQNPRTVTLSYGDNPFTVTVTPLNGTPQNHTLIIERYYEKVMLEYADVPTISCNPSTNGGLTFTGFQWYRSGEAIDGATRPYYQVKDNAIYYCELTTSSGRMRTINILPQSLRVSGSLTAFPNPTQGKVTVQSTNTTGNTQIQVFDANGSLVLQPETNIFDMSALRQGMYFIKVNGETVKVFKTN